MSNILNAAVVKESRRILSERCVDGAAVPRPVLAKALQKSLALPRKSIKPLTQIVTGALALSLFDTETMQFSCVRGRFGGIVRVDGEGADEAK